MPDTTHVTPRNGDVLLLVGTMKGAFILRANKARKKCSVRRHSALSTNRRRH